MKYFMALLKIALKNDVKRDQNWELNDVLTMFWKEIEPSHLIIKLKIVDAVQDKAFPALN